MKRLAALIAVVGSIVFFGPGVGAEIDDVLADAGEVVRLWRQEDNLRIEVTAMSEENGGLGKAIRVRLMGGGSAEQQFIGIVRGVADVEMQR